MEMKAVVWGSGDGRQKKKCFESCSKAAKMNLLYLFHSHDFQEWGIHILSNLSETFACLCCRSSAAVGSSSCELIPPL